MIIMGLLNLIYSLLSVLLVFELPAFPDSVMTVANSVTGYVQTGVSVLACFVGSTGMGIVALLLSLLLAMNAAYLLYSIVFWVIRKIPMLGVKE